MIVVSTICICLVPLGFILRQGFSSYLPFRPALYNPKRHHQHWLFTLSIAVTVAGLMYTVRSTPTIWPSLVALSCFLMGIRLSVVGITGSIASGKSTASKYISDRHGVVLIDADVVARQVVEKGSPGLQKIIKHFGESVIDVQTGELDRKALGSIIFSDIQKKKALERITHPAILKSMLKSIILNRILGRTVVIDVPLLFESRAPILYYMCHETLLVDASPDIQRERLVKRDPELSLLDIENRIKSQMPREQKLQFADYVIDNNGDVISLYRQLDQYFS